MAMRLRKTHGGSQKLRLRHSLNGFCSAHDHAGRCDDRVPMAASRSEHRVSTVVSGFSRTYWPDLLAGPTGRTYWSELGDPVNTLRPSVSVSVPPDALGDPFRAGDDPASVTASPVFKASLRHPARYS
jgi:hypothetical protein